MGDTRSDLELVAEAATGSSAAFGVLVRRWSSAVHAVCRARVRSPETCQDLAHESFLRAWRNLSSLDDPGRFGPWLRGIAIRACIDWLKAKERTQILEGDLGDSFEFASNSPGPDFRAERRDELDRLGAAVASLPESMRETLMLFYFDRCDYRRIAEITGVSVAAVNARLARARGLLRARLENSGAPALRKVGE